MVRRYVHCIRTWRPSTWTCTFTITRFSVEQTRRQRYHNPTSDLSHSWQSSKGQAAFERITTTWPEFRRGCGAESHWFDFWLGCFWLCEIVSEINFTNCGKWWFVLQSLQETNKTNEKANFFNVLFYLMGVSNLNPLQWIQWPPKYLAVEFTSDFKWLVVQFLAPIT